MGELPAGNMTLLSHVGRRRRQMSEQNNADQVFSTAMAFYKNLPRGNLKNRKTPSDTKLLPFSTGC